MSNNNRKIQIRIRDELAEGKYSNSLYISHTKEEFLLDFALVSPHGAHVTARVITSPGHMKRIISAMQENVRNYESQYGEIEPSIEPRHGKDLGFKP